MERDDVDRLLGAVRDLAYGDYLRCSSCGARAVREQLEVWRPVDGWVRTVQLRCTSIRSHNPAKRCGKVQVLAEVRVDRAPPSQPVPRPGWKPTPMKRAPRRTGARSSEPRPPAGKLATAIARKRATTESKRDPGEEKPASQQPMAGAAEAPATAADSRDSVGPTDASPALLPSGAAPSCTLRQVVALLGSEQVRSFVDVRDSEDVAAFLALAPDVSRALATLLRAGRMLAVHRRIHDEKCATCTSRLLPEIERRVMEGQGLRSISAWLTTQRAPISRDGIRRHLQAHAPGLMGERKPVARPGFQTAIEVIEACARWPEDVRQAVLLVLQLPAHNGSA